MAATAPARPPRFRRRLLGYAPAQVDAYLALALRQQPTPGGEPDGEEVTERVGREMASVLRHFATSVVTARQQAEADATRLREEALDAAAAIRADAEAGAAGLLERAEAIRAEAESTAARSALDAATASADLRAMAHELVDRVLGDTFARLASITAACERVQGSLDDAEAGLHQARHGLAGIVTPDTAAVGAKAHEVVDLITLEAQPGAVADAEPVGADAAGPADAPDAPDERGAATGDDGETGPEDSDALSVIESLYQRTSP